MNTDTPHLTSKQEAFCLAHMETGNASEAYRRCYNTDNMKPETIHRKAKELTDNGKIAARLAELQASAAIRNSITVDSLIQELEAARTAAMNAPNPQCTAAIAATMGKAKLLGLLVNKSEVTGHGGKDLLPALNPAELTDAQLAAIVAGGALQ